MQMFPSHFLNSNSILTYYTTHWFFVRQSFELGKKWANHEQPLRSCDWLGGYLQECCADQQYRAFALEDRKWGIRHPEESRLRHGAQVRQSQLAGCEKLLPMPTNSPHHQSVVCVKHRIPVIETGQNYSQTSLASHARIPYVHSFWTSNGGQFSPAPFSDSTDILNDKETPAPKFRIHLSIPEENLLTKKR